MRWLTKLDNLYKLAESLAKPVSQGNLPLEQAHAGLICAVLRCERYGTLGGYKASDIIRGLRHILRLHLDKKNENITTAQYKIERIIKPMIASRKHRGALLAEAHGVNGAAGFPMSEQEVNDLVTYNVFSDLPTKPWGGSNVKG